MTGRRGNTPVQPAYAPLTIAEVYAVLERHKKRLLCAPDVYEQVQSAVREARLEGVYQLLENRYLNNGQVVLMASEAEMEKLMFPLPQGLYPWSAPPLPPDAMAPGTPA